MCPSRNLGSFEPQIILRLFRSNRQGSFHQNKRHKGIDSRSACFPLIPLEWSQHQIISLVEFQNQSRLQFSVTCVTHPHQQASKQIVGVAELPLKRIYESDTFVFDIPVHHHVISDVGAQETCGSGFPALIRAANLSTESRQQGVVGRLPESQHADGDASDGRNINRDRRGAPSVEPAR